VLRALLPSVRAGGGADDLSAVSYSDCSSPEEPESSASKASEYKKLSELLSEVEEGGGFREAGEREGEKERENF